MNALSDGEARAKKRSLKLRSSSPFAIRQSNFIHRIPSLFVKRTLFIESIHHSSIELYSSNHVHRSSHPPVVQRAGPKLFAIGQSTLPSVLEVDLEDRSSPSEDSRVKFIEVIHRPVHSGLSVGQVHRSHSSIRSVGSLVRSSHRTSVKQSPERHSPVPEKLKLIQYVREKTRISVFHFNDQALFVV